MSSLLFLSLSLLFASAFLLTLLHISPSRLRHWNHLMHERSCTQICKCSYIGITDNKMINMDFIPINLLCRVSIIVCLLNWLTSIAAIIEPGGGPAGSGASSTGLDLQGYVQKTFYEWKHACQWIEATFTVKNRLQNHQFYLCPRTCQQSQSFLASCRLHQRPESRTANHHDCVRTT